MSHRKNPIPTPVSWKPDAGHEATTGLAPGRTRSLSWPHLRLQRLHGRPVYTYPFQRNRCHSYAKQWQWTGLDWTGIYCHCHPIHCIPGVPHSLNGRIRGGERPALRWNSERNITRLCIGGGPARPAICGRANVHFSYSRGLRAKNTRLRNVGKFTRFCRRSRQE